MSELSQDVLRANCRIRSGNVGGSGTVIYSKENEDGGFSTYILTNHHVVENNIKVDKKWSPLLKRDVKVDVLGTVEAHFFKFQHKSRAIGATAIEADIMTYDKDEDLALLRLRDDEGVNAVAKLYPRGQESSLRLGMGLICIGCGLGEPPVITAGRLSCFNREIDNKEFWLSTAASIYGNSGGAVYIEDTSEFIGVPARIAVTGILGGDAITHLSYLIPITRVYKFLEDQMFRFIYDPSFTEAGEAKEREKKQKEEERRMAMYCGAEVFFCLLQN